MPELPEVETVRRVLQRVLPGHHVLSTRIQKPNMLRGQRKQVFINRLQGQKILSVDRRAKYLLIRLRKGTLFIHLGMSGQVFAGSEAEIRTAAPRPLPDKHTHLQIRLNRGIVLYGRDPRMFGRYQVLDRNEEERLLSPLGPEPLGRNFSPEILYQRLGTRRAPLKALLLNQQLLAGLGNIYADEALFRAGLSPFIKGIELTPALAGRLHSAIRTVLREAVCARGTSISDYLDPQHAKGTFQLQLRVYGREGEACQVCGTMVRKTVLAQRGTHWCPVCQKDSKKRG